jgi:hypothetical protein
LINAFSDIKFNKLLFLSHHSLFKTNVRNLFKDSYLKIKCSSSITPLKYSSLCFIKKVNVFEQLEPIEPKHSLVLSTILDPKGSHGYGNIFLKQFFKAFPLEPMKMLDNEIWEVTAEKERFDIRIRNINNTKIIIIENKSNWAKDQENQLYRYWYNGIYLMQQQYRNINVPIYSRILYLSPSDYKQPTMQSISRPADWDRNLPDKVPSEIIKTVYYNEHVVNWLNLCVNAIGKGNDFSFYLSQYMDFWR